MAFNPPSGVADGATYGYGNVIWEYDAIFGVWNIVDGSIIGGVGPEGPPGPPGAGNIPLASYAVTGAAQFFNADFGVSVTGTVSLTGNVARTHISNIFTAAGGNSFSAGITAPAINTTNIYPFNVSSSDNGLSGYISMQPNLIGLVAPFISVGDEGGELANTYIEIDNRQANPYQPHISWTIGGAATMQLYSSGLVLGGNTYASPLQITGGIFRNPEEYASYQDLGSSNSIVINATGGSIQRFRITPSAQVVVSAGPGWDTTTTNATETIAVIVQSTNGKTGNFASTILSNNPVLFGVTGGIDMFTVMRVKTASSALLIGLPIANGLTAAEFSIS
jgi:hypothetical protein